MKHSLKLTVTLIFLITFTFLSIYAIPALSKTDQQNMKSSDNDRYNFVTSYIRDEDGELKVFTQVANLQYNKDGSFNLTFKNWSIVIGNSIKTKDGKEYKHKDLDKFFKHNKISRKGIIKKHDYGYEWGVNISNIDIKKYKFDKVGFEIINSVNITSLKRDGYCWIVNKEVKICFDDLLKYGFTIEYNNTNKIFYVSNVRGREELFLDPTVFSSSDLDFLHMGALSLTEVVVCYDDNTNDYIACQVLYTNGTVKVSEFVIDSTVNRYGQDTLSVFAISTDEFGVCWQDDGDDDISCAVYYTNGTTETAQWDVDTLSVLSDGFISTTVLSLNEFVVCYDDDGDDDCLYCGVYYTNGTAETSLWAVDTTLDYAIQEPISLFAISSDEFGICWSNSNDDDAYCAIYYKNGTVKVSSWLVNTNSKGDPDYISTILLTVDEFVVCFYDGVWCDITCAVYYTNGTIKTSAWDVDTTTGEDPGLSVFAISTDEFGVCWQDDGDDDISCAVYYTNGTTETAQWDVDTTVADLTTSYLSTVSQTFIQSPNLCEDCFSISWIDTDSTDIGAIEFYKKDGTLWDGECPPPTWSSFGQNATSISAGDTIQMWANISDDVALDYAWLATNESGTWINYTTTAGRYIDLSGTPTNTIVYLNWSNNSFTGTFNWKIYFNDTSGNVNSTIILPKYKMFNINSSAISYGCNCKSAYPYTDTPPMSSSGCTGSDSDIASSDDLYLKKYCSLSGNRPVIEIKWNKTIDNLFAVGSINISNEGHFATASYNYGVWVYNWSSGTWITLIDESGHDTDIVTNLYTTSISDIINSSATNHVYLRTSGNYNSYKYIYIDYVYMNISYNASFVTVTQSTDLSFSVGLPATGCTEGKGSTNADATCDRCWFEPTSWTMSNNLLSATQVSCEGQTSSIGFYNITNSGNVNLNITFALNETLDTTKFRNKMSQVSTGYESTCSGDVTTGCVYIESTTPVTVIWDLAPSNSQELWQWSDFINVALSDTKELSQNITSSQS